MRIAERISNCGTIPCHISRLAGDTGIPATELIQYVTTNARSRTRTDIPLRMRDFKSAVQWLCSADRWNISFRLYAKKPDIYPGIPDTFSMIAERIGVPHNPQLPCRNGGTGRRDGLKIRFWKQSVGSIPTFGTTLRPTIGHIDVLESRSRQGVRDRDPVDATDRRVLWRIGGSCESRALTCGIVDGERGPADERPGVRIWGCPSARVGET